MKIVENNPNQLILRSDPFGQIIFGLLFALAGLAFTYFFARSVDMHCEHVKTGQITCQLTDKLLGITPVRTRTISNITSADVEKHRSNKRGYTYEVTLSTTNDGAVSVTGFSSSGYSPKAEIAQQVNDFIQNERTKTLDIQVGMEYIVLIFLFVFVGVGIGAVVTAKTVQVEMIRSEGTLRIRRDGLFGSSQQEFLLREIQHVELQVHRSRKSASTYRIALYTTSNEEIALSSFYTSGYEDKKRAVEAMREFLSPYQRFKNQDLFP